MTLKPPSKPLPKLVIKEWPEPMTPDEWADVAERLRDGRMVVYSPKPLSDFTRVLEGVQTKSQKDRPPSNED